MTPSDAAAVALRAALLRSALVAQRRGAGSVRLASVPRRQDRLQRAPLEIVRDDVRKRRTVHAQHLEAPHDALCGLWDDGETVQAMTLAADALKQARLDGVTVADVEAASEALQTETLEVAAVDDALRGTFVSPEDADLERELEALLDPVPAPELPDFPSVPVEELSLAGLSLAEPPAPASPVAARTPVPPNVLCCSYLVARSFMAAVSGGRAPACAASYAVVQRKRQLDARSRLSLDIRVGELLTSPNTTTSHSSCVSPHCRATARAIPTIRRAARAVRCSRTDGGSEDRAVMSPRDCYVDVRGPRQLKWRASSSSYQDYQPAARCSTASRLPTPRGTHP